MLGVPESAKNSQYWGGARRWAPPDWGDFIVIWINRLRKICGGYTAHQFNDLRRRTPTLLYTSANSSTPETRHRFDLTAIDQLKQGIANFFVGDSIVLFSVTGNWS